MERCTDRCACGNFARIGESICNGCRPTAEVAAEEAARVEAKEKEDAFDLDLEEAENRLKLQCPCGNNPRLFKPFALYDDDGAALPTDGLALDAYLRSMKTLIGKDPRCNACFQLESKPTPKPLPTLKELMDDAGERLDAEEALEAAKKETKKEKPSPVIKEATMVLSPPEDGQQLLSGMKVASTGIFNELGGEPGFALGARRPHAPRFSTAHVDSRSRASSPFLPFQARSRLRIGFRPTAHASRGRYPALHRFWSPGVCRARARWPRPHRLASQSSRWRR